MVRKANPALLKPYNLSADLEAVVGKGPLPRGQVVKKIWEYIKKHNLQPPDPAGGATNEYTPEQKRHIFQLIRDLKERAVVAKAA